MSDERALLAAIFAEPDEDTPRLAYADWLDEHATALPDRDPAEVHARAAFIRLQIEAERAPSAAKRTDLGNRAKALWRLHKTAWEAAYHATGAPPYPWPEFHRGFIRAFVCTPATLAHLPAVAAACPIVELDVDGTSGVESPDLTTVTASPDLARLRRINFLRFPESAARPLLSSPHLTGLSSLRMRWGWVEGAVELASASPVASCLRELWAWGSGTGGVNPGVGLGTLVSAEWPALERVRLDNFALTNANVLTLVSAFAERGRKGLHVSASALTPEGVRAAVAAVVPGRLGSISLAQSADYRNPPPEPVADARELRFEGFYSDGDALVNWLAGAVPPGRFDRLGVVRSRQSLTHAGARALAAWPGLAHLKELDLSDNWIGDAGAKELANSPHLDGLELLHVAHNDITKRGKDALKARFGRRVRVA
jgi:uncharacterized protein (TIGR02996 family)